MARSFKKAVRTILLCTLLAVFSLPVFSGSSEILLQGFNWESHDVNWYNTLRDKAGDIAAAGVTMVWFPQPASSSGGMGYLPQKYYDLNNAVGSQSQLKEAITAMHNNNLKVLADIVINHRVGVNDWADFQDPAWGTWAVCSDDEWGQGTGNSDSGDQYAAGRDLDHSNTTVQDDIKTWLNWLKDSANAGFDGWRYDYSKGYWGGYVKIYNEASTPYFSVGEFWPDIPGDQYNNAYPNTDWHRQILVDWINATGGTSTAFDFTTKWQLQLAMENNELWRLGNVPGLIGWWGNKAVTFLDNHDTGSTQAHWPFPGAKVMQGYAYTLTHPGIPSIFWDHLFDWGLYDSIKDLITARKAAGVTSDSTVTVDKAEASLYAAYVGSNLAMKIGSGSWSPSGSDWVMKASGTDYAVWVKGTPTPVTFNPTTGVAGQTITVTYNGTLKSSATLTMNWGYDNFSNPQTAAMTKQTDGSWTVTVTIPAAATSSFDCSFTDGSTTDDNSGSGYHANVSSNATVNVTIHYGTSWTTANIHYKNNGTWTTAPGEAMTKYRDGWYSKTIARQGSSLEFVFNNGTTWDNNGDQNYTSTLTNLWVTGGVITSYDPATNNQATVSFSPASPVAGQSVTVTYNGTLKSSSSVTMHWGYDGWSGVTDSVMTKQTDGTWKVTVTVPAAATNKMDAVFTDGTNWDNNGGSDYSAPVSNGGDTQAPVASISSPANGTTISGTVPVAATATDNVGVTRVELYVNNVKKAESTTSPYSFSIDTTLYTNGPASIKVTAYDAAGNNGSATVNVTISNGSAQVLKKVHYYKTQEGKNAFIQYKQGQNEYNAYPGEKMSDGTGIWKTWSKTLDDAALNVRFKFSGGLWDYNGGDGYTFSANEVWIKNGVVYLVNPDQDNEKPVVNLTAPANGSTVSNTITLSATATDNEGVVRVDFAVDGTVVGTDSTSPYSITWDSTTVDNGSRTITATAYDAAGNSEVSTIQVTVGNPVIPDNPPTVDTLTVPAGTVTGNGTVSATASDDKGIAKVGFYIDSTLIGEVTTAPYTVTFASGSFANGVHAVKAVAYDTTGQTAEKTNTVTIYNEPNTTKPYSVNPTVGTYISGGITIDGANNGEWNDNNLIAIGMANDDPRSLGDNWSMHETPWDMTHLWAAWDDNNLYIAWQYVDVTDMIDPANAGSSAGTKPFQMNLIQFIAFDTVAGQGSSKDMWGKNGGEDYWTGADLPDWQIYVASNLWQGYISKAVNGTFVVDGTDPAQYQKFVQNPAQGSTVGTAVGTSGIEIAWGNFLAANNLWGVTDCDHALTSPIDQTKVVDFKTMGHDGGRDTFYEMKIPLAFLGITRAQLESQGIGVMLGQGEYSSLNTLPFDPATVDTPGVTDSNSPREWEDIDHFTVPFARIGHLK